MLRVLTRLLMTDHHEENILTLMRSLRLTDSVQNQIEHKIKKGGEE